MKIKLIITVLVLIFCYQFSFSSNQKWLLEELPNTVEKSIYQFNYSMNYANNEKIFYNLNFLLEKEALSEFQKIYKWIFSEKGTLVVESKAELEKKRKEEETLLKDSQSSSSSSSSSSERSASIISSFSKSISQSIVLDPAEKEQKEKYLDIIRVFILYAKNLVIQILEISYITENEAQVRCYFHNKENFTQESKLIDLIAYEEANEKLWKITKISSPTIPTMEAKEINYQK